MGKPPKIDDVVCTACLTRFQSPRQSTFLGFRKYFCPQCQTRVIYPLTSGQFGCYIVVLGLVGLIMIASILAGGFAVPGLLAIAAVIALINNRGIRTKVNQAEQKAGWDTALRQRRDSGEIIQPVPGFTSPLNATWKCTCGEENSDSAATCHLCNHPRPGGDG